MRADRVVAFEQVGGVYGGVGIAVGGIPARFRGDLPGFNPALRASLGKADHVEPRVMGRLDREVVDPRANAIPTSRGG